MALPESGGLHPPSPPGSYTYEDMQLSFVSIREINYEIFR